MKDGKKNVAIVLGKTAFVTSPEMDYMTLFVRMKQARDLWIQNGCPRSLARFGW